MVDIKKVKFMDRLKKGRILGYDIKKKGQIQR